MTKARAIAIGSSAAWWTLAALSFGSCTQVVDVRGYAFDVDPCGPRPRACLPGGPTRTYVAVYGGFTRADAMGHRPGADLDGTSEAICGQNDFTSPTGATGIDDQLSFLIEGAERLGGGDSWADNRDSVVAGGETSVMFVDGVDGDDDDCVQVTLRRGQPTSVPPQVLDADGDGELDASLVFDYTTPDLEAERACVVDGVLHARFPDGEATAGSFGSVFLRHGRLRAVLEPDRLSRVLFAGGILISDLERVLDPEVARVGALTADLDPSSRDAFDCQTISMSTTIDYVPAVRGTMR